MAFMIIMLHCNCKNCFYTYSRHAFKKISLHQDTICVSIFLQLIDPRVSMDPLALTRYGRLVHLEVLYAFTNSLQCAHIGQRFFLITFQKFLSTMKFSVI